MKRQSIFVYYFILLAFMYPVSAAEDYPIWSTSETATIYFGVELDGSEPAPAFTLPVSHTDIEIPLRFFGWDIHLHSEAAGRVETEDGLFDVNESYQYQLTSVPSSLAFLGVAPDQIFWYYRDEPCPGFDSQDMGAETGYLWAWDPNDPDHNAHRDATWLKVQLIDVRGPENGTVSMFHEGSGNPIAFFSTVDGIDDTDVYYIPVNQHVHNSWAFTQPGLYEVDIQVSTVYACDGALTGDLTDDCFVDMADYAVISRNWFRNDCGDPNHCGALRLTDPNEINLEDLGEMTDQWLLCGSPFESECP